MLNWVTEEIIFEYFLRNFYLRYPQLVGKVDIGYGDQTKRVNIISNTQAAFFQKGNLIKKQQLTYKKYRNEDLVFFFGNGNEEIVSYESGKATIHQDLVASVFYLLSGYDELIRGNFDQYDRVIYKDGIVAQCQLIQTPVINYYFEILKDVLEKCYEMHIQPKTGFSLVLSHDIDMIYSGWKMLTKKYLKSGHLWKIPGLLFNRVFNGDALYNFSLIQQIEQKYDAQSTYFFLPSVASYKDTKNADYDAAAYRIQKVMLALEKKGHEIGVHGSFGTSTSSEQLTNEMTKLKGSVVGNRFHYLMFENNKTPRVLDQAHIKYDSSLGFAEHIGFRRGICTPFFLMDFERKKVGACIELPLLVMDASLAFDKYMGVSAADSFEVISNLWDEVKRLDGLFTVLWHNNMFNDELYPGWRALYEKILQKAKEENVSTKLGGEIVNELLSINN